ncbi:MAG: hypothetical protein RMK51_13080 [Meiothermus sp.]|uniref:hypothetical protein n=1 Tax=Meiothermus sp. TaxID=1955249 RepID=UPI00298EFE93|nr:hypothetical protein [Meiothermus sp.]MDW8426857.1 hypothetical protein [Meiothermus sp.]
MRNLGSGQWLLSALAGVLLLAACGSPSNSTPSTPPISESMSVEEARFVSNDLELQGRAPEQQVVFDFSGKVEEGPSKDTVLSGRLTLELKPVGGGHFVFMGALSGTNLNVPAKGVLTRGGRIYIFFEVDKANNLLIIGTGKREAGGVFKGPFIGPAAGDKGRWTATPVSGPTPMPAPTPQKLAYTFSGLVEDGPAKGTKLEGRLNLEVRQKEGYGRLEGKLVLADGGEIPVKGALAGNKKVFVIFDLGRGSRIVGEGDIQADKSIQGPFVLVQQDSGRTSLSRGSWTAKPIP